MEAVILTDVLHANLALSGLQYVGAAVGFLLFGGLVVNIVYQVTSGSRPHQMPEFQGPALM